MRASQSNPLIISNLRSGEKYCKLVFKDKKISRIAVPGQFLMLKVSDSREPLLRRPLSIHAVNAEKVELFYEVLGKGTRMLSQRRPGESLDMLGPLGNGFDFGDPLKSGRAPVLVAGGMGVAPLVFLAKKLAQRKIRVLIGARSKSQILCEKEFKKLGCDVRIATDDGSRGFSGRVTGLLEKLLVDGKFDPGGFVIYGCGPKPMLRELGRISRTTHIPAQLSLEAHMACGIGACLGCVVNTVEGYRRVCKDGPVFDSQKLIF